MYYCITFFTVQYCTVLDIYSNSSTDVCMYVLLGPTLLTVVSDRVTFNKMIIFEVGNPVKFDFDLGLTHEPQ